MSKPDIVILAWFILKLVVDAVGIIYLIRRLGGG